MEDYSMHMKDFSSDLQDNEEDRETESQAGHSFTDGTNFCCGQTFADKKELKMQLNAAATRQSFDYYMEKSCTKLMKAQCLSRGCGWLLRVKKYDTLDRFCIYRYVGMHTCGVENATRRHKKVSSELIASVCVNHFWDGKGPSIREIQRIVFNELRCNASYWMCWKGSVIVKNIIRETPEHGYACLPAFFHMVEVIAVDDTHLYGKYGGVLLSAVAQDTENNIFLIAFCVVDTENDASWTFFFQKLKSIIEDEPDLCVISDRHISIANAFSRVYSRAHHGLCMRNLAENLCSVSDSLYVGNPNGVLDEYTVFGNDVTTKVNLLERSCSCQKFDLVKMSCEHAMAALRAKYGDGEDYGNSIYDYSSLIYKDESYLLAYSEAINVVPPEAEWTMPQELTTRPTIGWIYERTQSTGL
ncbi:uncharacterized protein LOC124894022 [Capsicum annuum]|uniref:uncharacterized protein LOC124894022 n=1 Tax=Capsicum annuum TaxID=4072 RepID=UPI001FB08855|nr:uncharacterized protein LOC124894022 [Capsicum annuum]